MASFTWLRAPAVAGSLISLFFCASLLAAPLQPAVVSAHPMATRAGMDILERGGNAFDAAVTVAAVLAVVEPYSSGFGGGGFWLLQSVREGHPVMIDGRERAPLAAHRNMYLDDAGRVRPGLSIDGPLAAGIPGQAAALVHIQEKFGSLPLDVLFSPAIDLAEHGFHIDAHYRRMAQFRIDALTAGGDAGKVLLDAGHVPATGKKVVQTDLANTLRAITRQGHKGFYAGPVAQKLVRGVRDAGGIWTLQDLAEYRVVERAPVRFSWRGLDIITASLPSSGGIALAQILKQLDALGWDNRRPVRSVHYLVEAMRRTYRDRAQYLGDPDHAVINSEKILSDHYIQKLVADIHAHRATASDSLPGVTVRQQEGRDTTHYAVLDRQGNRVSATLSINYPFGSGFMVPGTGILLNDEMDDFSISPGVPNVYGLVGNEVNAIAGGKRMLSSMTPTFVESTDMLALVGTPGGSRIITMVLQAVLGLKQGLSPRTIVSRPRIHHQYLPDEVQLEKGALNRSQRRQLRDMGHRLRELEHSFGNMQIIVHDKKTGATKVASDPRGMGQGLAGNAVETAK